ncbi:hypothetical protein ACFVHB_39925 [Kitasatospora sp. NPDC127111]|uniref:hypothetical protein n=1 Tax=Kitasatospora sp. NPDC127111 TaxID=3345363 RepID=UPI0036350701
MTMNTNSAAAGTHEPWLPGVEQAVAWLAASVAMPVIKWMMAGIGKPAPGPGSAARFVRRVADALDQLEKDEQRKKRDRRRR